MVQRLGDTLKLIYLTLGPLSLQTQFLYSVSTHKVTAVSIILQDQIALLKALYVVAKKSIPLVCACVGFH